MEEGTMAAVYGIQHTGMKIEIIFHVYFDLGLLDFFLTRKAQVFSYHVVSRINNLCEYEYNTKIAGSAIPPLHVLFTLDSNYLLDALVSVPLPFFFLVVGFFLALVFRISAFSQPAAYGRLFARPHRAFLPSPPSLAMFPARSCSSLFG